MAVLWMDGFDTYTATADLAGRYLTGGNCTLNTTSGRFGGGSFASSSTITTAVSNLYVNITHSGSSAIVAGGTTYFTGNANVAYPILGFYNSLAGTPINEVSLYYDVGTGTLKLYRGASTGGTLLATSTATYQTGVWHFIEMRANIADAGGAVEVRVNGVSSIISFSGDTRISTTGTAGIDRIYFGTWTLGAVATAGGWDDIFILDTSGSVANNFLGDVRVNTLAPTSDSSVQFTKSTGASNFSCIDEGRYNSDTDYVESSTVGHVDRYGYTDLAAAVATVYGVQATTWCRKTDATTRTMRNVLLSNATTSNGASFALMTAYQPMVTTLTLNPDGSVAWTPATANAASAGFEVLT